MSHIPARPEQSQEFTNAKAIVAAALARAHALARPSESADSTADAMGFLNVECGGTAGAILRAVRGLSRKDLAFVLAACGPRSFGRQPETRSRWPWRNDDIWHSATEFVRLFSRAPALRKQSDANLGRWLVERHFGAEHKCAAIAESIGIAPGTVELYARAISAALAAEECSIWSSLLARLRAIGVIDGIAAGSLA